MNNVLWRLEEATLGGSRRPRLDGASLVIREGITGVVGPSGAGKTSLLNLLVGFERPDGGRINLEFDDAESTRLPVYWAPQDDGLWPHLTAAEHLEVVAPDDATVETDELLDAFDLGELREARPPVLSQGERSRLAVARALAADARVLVMDEPLVHVDPARQGRFWAALRQRLAATGASLVFSSHAPETVVRETDRTVCLADGRVKYEGPTADLYHAPATADLAAFLGPFNWFENEDAEVWLADEHAEPRLVESPATPYDGRPRPSTEPGDSGEQARPPYGRASFSADRTGCIRPERLEVRSMDAGPLVVESTRFAGSTAELEVRDNRRDRVRKFFHRPSGPRLAVGDRVSLRVVALLLSILCGSVCGCGGGDAAELPVANVEYTPAPPLGRKIPAPRGLAVGPNGDVYVLDKAGRVIVFNAEGERLREWFMPDREAGAPEDACVLKDGRVAVADTHYQRVVLFTQTGEVDATFGSEGRGTGQFIYPVALTQDDKGAIYVAEYGGNDRVQKFTPEGECVLEFGGQGTGPGEFQRPAGIVWQDGRVYVADAANNRIQVFADDGRFERVLNSAPEAELHYPYDLDRGPDGVLYAIEYGAGRVTAFRSDGALVGRYGSFGRSQGRFANPWGVAVAPDGQTIYVADTGNRRLAKLRMK